LDVFLLTQKKGAKRKRGKKELSRGIAGLSYQSHLKYGGKNNLDEKIRKKEQSRRCHGNRVQRGMERRKTLPPAVRRKGREDS